jgi:hypothetical protein
MLEYQRFSGFYFYLCPRFKRKSTFFSVSRWFIGKKLVILQSFFGIPLSIFLAYVFFKYSINSKNF